MDNPHTTANVIAGYLVLNTVVAELTSLLTPKQRALLRARLKDHADNIGPIDEFEPDCSDCQRARYAEFDDLLAPMRH